MPKRKASESIDCDAKANESLYKLAIIVLIEKAIEDPKNEDIKSILENTKQNFLEKFKHINLNKFSSVSDLISSNITDNIDYNTRIGTIEAITRDLSKDYQENGLNPDLLDEEYYKKFISGLSKADTQSYATDLDEISGTNVFTEQLARYYKSKKRKQEQSTSTYFQNIVEAEPPTMDKSVVNEGLNLSLFKFNILKNLDSMIEDNADEPYKKLCKSYKENFKKNFLSINPRKFSSHHTLFNSQFEDNSEIQEETKERFLAELTGNFGKDFETEGLSEDIYSEERYKQDLDNLSKYSTAGLAGFYDQAHNTKYFSNKLSTYSSLGQNSEHNLDR